MEHLRSERDGNVLILSLARGKANPLNRDLIEELYTAVAEAAADDGVRALVLASDRPRFFSTGFDVGEVFGYDRAQMADFFGRFVDVYESLYRLPKPVVAALSGHTFAGGAILACACDFRIMAEGDFGFALNEINLGLALPPGLRRIVVQAAGMAGARELLLLGEPISPARALAVGLVKELAPADEVRQRAVRLAGLLGGKPPGAYGAIKQSLRQLAGGDGGGDREVLEGPFVEMWFSEEAVRARQAVAARMAAPRTSAG